MFDKKEYARQYYIKNREKLIEYSRQWRLNDPEYIKRYFIKNKKEILKQKRQYYIDNSKKLKEQHKEYCSDNPERIKEIQKKYCKNNRGKINKYICEWMCNKRKTDLKFNLNGRMSEMIRQSLKGNKVGRHWENLVGYTLTNLIKRLKKTMPEGYNWKDFLNSKLHIDHKIPMSVFNFSKPEHSAFKRCWALKNLRLLPAKENIIKSNKLDKPFQPALQIY